MTLRFKTGFAGWQCALAGVFSLFSVVGFALNGGDSLDPLLESATSALLGLGAFIALWAVYYIALGLVFMLFDKARERGSRREPAPLSLRGHRLNWAAFAGILLVAWLPYFIYFFPGGIPSDTSHQLAQFAGTPEAPLDNHFPYLAGLFFNALFRMGSVLFSSDIAGIAFMTGAQMLVGAATLATIVSRLQRLGAQRWIVLCSLALFALFPLVPAHAVTVSKDFVHSCLVALLLVQALCKVAAAEGTGAPPAGKHAKGGDAFASWPALAAVALLVSLTRNNGVLIAAFVFVSLAVALRPAKWRVASLEALAAVAVAFVAWNAVVLPAAGVAPGEIGEALSVPLQMTARCEWEGDQLSPDDEAALRRFSGADASTWANLYDARTSDPVKGTISLNDIPDALEVCGIAGRAFAAYPTDALEGALCTTFGYWYPFCRGTYWDEDAPYNCPPDDAYALSGAWLSDATWVDAWNGRTGTGQAVLHALHVSVPLLRDLYRPGVYLWLVLICAAYALQRKTRRRATGVVVVPLVSLAAVLLLGPCCSLRYTLPFILSLPALAYLVCGRSADMREEQA